MSSIRTAAIGDVALLVELMTEFYAESDLALPSGPAAATFEQLLRDDRLGRAWILEAEGQVAGYVVLTLGYSMEYGGLRGFVDDFYVRPRFRGRGVGTAALAEVRHACMGLGVRALVAEVGGSDGAAQAVYRKERPRRHRQHVDGAGAGRSGTRRLSAGPATRDRAWLGTFRWHQDVWAANPAQATRS